MKKLILGAGILAMAFVSESQAQTIQSHQSGSGFYVGIHGGYNLPIATQNISQFNFTNETEQTGANRFDDILLSLGKGGNAGVNIGYMFNQYVGAELGVDYLFGSKYNATYNDASDPDYHYDQYLSAKMLQFRPSVVLKSGFKEVSPYAKFGVVLGVASSIKYEQTETFGADNFQYQLDMEEGLAFGITGALGIDYAINPKISVFGEITATNLNYAPQKGYVTKAMQNGTDFLPDLDVRDKEIEFLDDFTDDGTANEPARQQRQSYPFSSVGLNLGVKYKF